MNDRHEDPLNASAPGSAHTSPGLSPDDIAEIEARLRDLERAEARLAEREKELAETSAAMARDLRDTAEQLKQKEHQLSSVGELPEHLRRRRSRLQRIRAVLRDRATKLQRYEAVLDDRAREADQILAQRREIAKAAAAVQSRERKLATVQARNKTMSASFFVVAAIGILGVLSFAVADHIAPATYAAKAEVQVDARGRALAPDEIDEWQRYIEALVTDPGLLEIAADRMGKRGIASLSRAADLRVRLEQDLTTSAPSQGRLAMELVGEGSAATRRALDTYVVAIVAQSNATKNQRAGGTGTRVSLDAEILDTPIEDERMVYAAGVGGGASLLGLLIGMTVYRKLRRQHQDFERGVID